MPAYVVFTRTKTIDQKELEEYWAGIRATMKGHPIEILVAYGRHEVLEGDPIEGIVIAKFANVKAAKDWYYSEAYQNVAQHRKRVKRHDGRADAEYLVTGRLEKLEELDYDGSVKVVVAISAQMIRVDTGATIWTKAVTKVGNVDKRDVPAVVSAMSDTMDSAMQELLTPLPTRLVQRRLSGTRTHFVGTILLQSDITQH